MIILSGKIKYKFNNYIELQKMRIAGVEPAPPDYETDTLPLRHTRCVLMVCM